VVVLGIAYALVEEGLADQSLFNPHWPGGGATLLYGRWLGINWYWGEYLLGWHAVWSITLPILFTYLMFPARRTTSWVGPAGLRSVGLVYGLSVAVTFVVFLLTQRFLASPPHLSCTALLVSGVAAVALLVRPRTQGARALAGPGLGAPLRSCWLLGLAAFLAGAAWLGAHEILLSALAPPILVLLQLGLALAVAAGLAAIGARAWSAGGWADRRLAALAWGTLLGGEVAGIAIVQDGWPVDLLAQIVWLVLTVVLLARSLPAGPLRPRRLFT
jgi:hypothetical protein